MEKFLIGKKRTINSQEDYSCSSAKYKLPANDFSDEQGSQTSEDDSALNESHHTSNSTCSTDDSDCLDKTAIQCDSRHKFNVRFLCHTF